ncbi:hypothetical protein G5714_010506 [Onychostoma macrolepis]|uniref:Ig-like domain-containing protein n=1 Tax=Onychostoma macrolepis TaxID=369639 RepID=A0A7J6CSC9_9TELE|nr:hypothetical protein G5714_010506 [Onychostoma macrolepis]
MLEQMIIAMAVLLTLFCAELTESSSSCCLCKAEIKRVDENATAFVSCPALAEHENPSISLYKGETKLHSTNLSDVYSNQSQQEFQAYIQNSSVSYKILSAKASDTGLYLCKINTQIRTAASQTILLIKGALQPIESTVTCTDDQTLGLAVGIGAITIYDIAITAFVCYLRYKLKNKEPPENPYINTRPRGFQRR